MARVRSREIARVMAISAGFRTRAMARVNASSG